MNYVDFFNMVNDILANEYSVNIIDEDVIRLGLDQLAAKDKYLAVGLELVGYPPPRIRPHGFATLLNIIVGQQISVKAAASILGRLHDIMAENTAMALLDLTIDEIRSAGMSLRKAEYATGVAKAIVSGELDIAALLLMDDKTVINELIKLRGIGRWSGEIYAMFSLGRRDIFPADDIALQEAFRRLKLLDNRPTGKEIRQLTENWAPWRSVGALFLWHYYHGAPS